MHWLAFDRRGRAGSKAASYAGSATSAPGQSGMFGIGLWRDKVCGESPLGFCLSKLLTRILERMSPARELSIFCVRQGEGSLPRPSCAFQSAPDTVAFLYCWRDVGGGDKGLHKECAVSAQSPRSLGSIISPLPRGWLEERRIF